MHLSVSNIAWGSTHDDAMLLFLKENCFSGIEIAPTRIFPENPYTHIDAVKDYACSLREKYSLKICSLQSIWFGRTEKIFGSPQEREALVAYTKKAIDFAAAAKCANLVFGCPKNRNLEDGMQQETAITFFQEIGEYAQAHSTVVAIEPNPAIYGTNFLNTTRQALDFVQSLRLPGIKINYDLGTVIENQEDLYILSENIHLIHHIHISEPFLLPIKKRDIHKELYSLLLQKNYQGFISLEMKNTGSIECIKSSLNYLKEVFA